MTGRRALAAVVGAALLLVLVPGAAATASGPSAGPARVGGAARTGAAPAAVAVTSIRLGATTVVSGLVDPVLVRSADDGTSRLFVLERAGRIRIVDGGRITGTYLDIRSGVRSGGEQGMLGLAFAPDFRRSRLVFVTFTRSDGALVLMRFTAPSVAAPALSTASRKTVLVVPHPTWTNHNGGDIAFGPDGYLYLGTGDGGSGGDPRNNAQNLRSLLGKMLRLDVRCAGRIYCSPATNPYVRSSTARHEIWLVGLRNPWRWSFDGATQWIGDVGQNSYEEIDAIPYATAAGRNLGWSCREGKHTYNAARCRSTVRYTTPVLELCHPDHVSSCPSARAAEAVIGGYVYRGAAYSGFAGTYVLGDYVTGRIWPYRSGVLGVPSSLPQVAGFGVDDDKELYAVTLAGRLVHVTFASV